MVEFKGDTILFVAKDKQENYLHDIILQTTETDLEISIFIKNLSNLIIDNLEFTAPTGVTLLNIVRNIHPQDLVELKIKFEKNKTFSGDIIIKPIIRDSNLN